MKALAVSYEIAWIFSAILIYGLCLIPCVYIINQSFGMPLPFRCFALASTPFAFTISLILLTGMIKQLFIPKMKEGKYAFPFSRQAFVWVANRWIADILLVPLSRLIFLNDILRWVSLRLLGAKIHYSTAISSPTISDFDLINIGKDITIGAWVKIYPHVQPGNGKIILSPITIGDGSFVGADCRLMGGSRIGTNVFMAHSTTVMLYNDIGDNVKIGWHCVIGNKTTIGSGAVIGNHCKIGRFVKIDPDVHLKNHSVVPDRAHVTKCHP